MLSLLDLIECLDRNQMSLNDNQLRYLKLLEDGEEPFGSPRE